MMRVLHVVKELGSGGIETMLMNIYRNIDRKKIQFDFAMHTEEKGFYEDEARQLGAKIFRFHNLNQVSIVEYKKEWNCFWQKHSKDYVVLHGHYRSHAVFFNAYAKKWGITTIAHSHSTFSKSIRGVMINVLMFPIRYSADYLFACSNEAGMFMFGRQFSKRGRIITNAIDIKKYIVNKAIAKRMREKHLLGDTFVIGHVGNYVKAKNHQFLIQVFSEIVKIRPNSKLILIGVGTDDKDNEMWKNIENLNLNDKVIGLGRNNQVCEWLQVMDAFVFPSIYEGLPVAVIEAQAAGVRCVISDTIPNEVLVSNEIMQKSINASAKEWAECVIDFCGNYVKSDTREVIREHGYDITAECKKLQEFYIRLGETDE